jgi:hypothetical protein
MPVILATQEAEIRRITERVKTQINTADISSLYF